MLTKFTSYFRSVPIPIGEEKIDKVPTEIEILLEKFEMKLPPEKSEYVLRDSNGFIHDTKFHAKVVYEIKRDDVVPQHKTLYIKSGYIKGQRTNSNGEMRDSVLYFDEHCPLFIDITFDAQMKYHIITTNFEGITKTIKWYIKEIYVNDNLQTYKL
jgi:hypothetical protein